MVEASGFEKKGLTIKDGLTLKDGVAQGKMAIGWIYLKRISERGR
jgi:hypothetical protein